MTSASIPRGDPLSVSWCPILTVKNRSTVICRFPYLSFRHFRKKALFWYKYYEIRKNERPYNMVFLQHSVSQNYFEPTKCIYPHLHNFMRHFLTQFTTMLSHCFYSSRLFRTHYISTLPWCSRTCPKTQNSMCSPKIRDDLIIT